jgi:molybdopterin molybdotransferase
MMLSFEKALQLVLNSARELRTEQVDVAHALNRILAEDVTSDIDMPPFNKAAMDGYACRRQDLAKELVIIETIPAGMSPQKPIGPGRCAKIMTGSMVPQGADCVIMKEFVENTNNDRIRFVGEKTADNICLRAEDIRAGEVALHKGLVIRPQHVAMLASIGHVQPIVAKRPSVTVIATGDELVDPAATPGPSQIRNSNSYQISAQVENIGLPADNYGAVKDTIETMDDTFNRAFNESDVVIISGGVSVGDYDLVPQVLRRNNFELLFEKIAVKPGRPTVFGISGNVYCFALPGNPVSSFVMFELLVKPFLYKMMGHNFRPSISHRKLAKTITRKKTDRDSWLPVAFTDDGRAARLEYHGSAHIGALAAADGLLCIPAGVKELKEDSTVAVRQI